MFPEVPEWQAQVQEDVLWPDLPICDAHAHLLDTDDDEAYLIDELARDVHRGHNVVSNVHIECNSAYRQDGPELLRPVGETEFVVRQLAAAPPAGAAIDAIVGFADLRAGAAIEEVLDAHVEAADGRFRGLRYGTARDIDPTVKVNADNAPLGLLSTPPFQEGLGVLARRGLSFDAWLYHPQLDEAVMTAQAIPDLVLIVNHLGGPLGVGRHQDREAVRTEWRASVKELASHPNIYLKLGGMGLPALGTTWSARPVPPTSAELAALWSDDFRFAIDTVGPDRCMFEANYPVERPAFSYVVQWNAYKRMAEPYSAEERAALFLGTAATAYRIDGA